MIVFRAFKEVCCNVIQNKKGRDGRGAERREYCHLSVGNTLIKKIRLIWYAILGEGIFNKALELG